jgi:hypothetical protein
MYTGESWNHPVPVGAIFDGAIRRIENRAERLTDIPTVNLFSHNRET